MMRRIRNELRIAGIDPVLLSLAVTAVFILLAAVGGELLNLSVVGFEVMFPIYTSIAVGEWGRIRADENFDLIAAQSVSLFRWVACRFAAVFAETAVFAVAAMLAVSALREEMPVTEMLLLYFPPAFFLSALSVLFGLCCAREHMATLLCGMVWLLTLTARSLLRLPGVEYVYLFLRFAGDENGVWLINRAVLCAGGMLLWLLIRGLCRE